MTALLLYTIYDRPRDFPGHVVVRPTVVSALGVRQRPCVGIYGSVDEAREDMRALGLYLIPRDVRDDPCIVETWV